jgi:hypothetical protein
MSEHDKPPERPPRLIPPITEMREHERRARHDIPPGVRRQPPNHPGPQYFQPLRFVIGLLLAVLVVAALVFLVF